MSVHSSTNEHLESVMIHVHKETGAEGHWCARIVFFALLAALISIASLIIFEHRNTADGMKMFFFYYSLVTTAAVGNGS